MSRVMCHNFFLIEEKKLLDKVVKLVSGGSVINGELGDPPPLPENVQT